MGEKMPPLSHVSMSGVLTELLGQDTEIHLAILVPSVAPTCRITIALRKKKTYSEIQKKITIYNTVDGQNPVPPRMMIIPLSIGF